MKADSAKPSELSSSGDDGAGIVPLDVEQYLEDFDDLLEAHETYVTDCAVLAESGNSQAGMALRWATGLQTRVERLNQAIASGYGAPALDQQWRSSAKVFIGKARRKMFTRQVRGYDAVLIDFDLALRLVLLIYVVGLNREDDIVADALSAFLLLSIVVPRDEEFPHTDRLMKCFAALNGRVLNDIFSIAGTFIVFHELGHSYAVRYPTDFLRVAFEIPPGLPVSPETVKSIRMHRDGLIYNQIEAPGTANGILVITPRLQHWKSEFAADVFAAYAEILAGANGRPRAIDLERWASVLACWQVLLFALGYRQQYMRWIGSDTALESFSHPVAEARMDVLLHHINFLAESFAPEWQSPALSLLDAQYESLWAADLRKLLLDAIEYVRYAFDEDGPDINVGRLRTFTGGPVPWSPSTLSRLGDQFLGPILSTAERVGWDAAVKNNRDEHIRYLSTFQLNKEPICLQLGKRLRDVNIRLISEDRE